MSADPVSQFGRLSLETMPPPPPRSKVRTADVVISSDDSDTESSSNSESDSIAASDDDQNEQTSPVVRSPSRLLYRLDQLPEDARTTVRDVFSDPPKISLQTCRRVDNTYAFQMTELVTRSVRIRAPDHEGDGEAQLSCSCKGEAQDEDDEDEEMCPHLLWLLDQLLKQTLYDHDLKEPLVMKPTGYAQEMGDPFQSISRHHLDVLAAGLHCPVIDPDSDDEVDKTRALEARELLAPIHSESPDDFRPDIFDRPTLGSKIIKRNDLDVTLFRMLLDNGHFFNYLLSLSRPSDPINDPFRKLSQRVDLVLRSLDSAKPSPSSSEEDPTTVRWAARHILGCTAHIRSSLYSLDRPMRHSEALSAASALVHILRAVVSRNRDFQSQGPRVDRNLYLRLIGDRDQNFVIDVLELLVPSAASHFLSDLEDCLDKIGLQGAPTTYVEKFRALLVRLRASSAGGSGLKRQGQGQGTDRGSKRMK